MEEKIDLDKIVKEVDRQFNCLTSTPLRFDGKTKEKVKRCLLK